MSKILRIVVGVLAVLGLFIIRAKAEILFYDPLIHFFKTNYHAGELPEIDTLGLVLNVSLRFWMNTLLSLVILWLLFKSREVVQLSLLVFGISFVLLLFTFSILIENYEAGTYRALFYVRRFLIQPLLLLLLIPAFYFHKLRK